MKQQEKGFLFSDYPDVLSIKDLRQALGIGCIRRSKSAA